VLQGIVGCIPWQAMVFFTLWLQLTGFSNSTASLLVATFGAGVALVSAGARASRCWRRPCGGACQARARVSQHASCLSRAPAIAPAPARRARCWAGRSATAWRAACPTTAAS
jgi:hypothetical protein